MAIEQAFDNLRSNIENTFVIIGFHVYVVDQVSQFCKQAIKQKYTDIIPKAILEKFVSTVLHRDKPDEIINTLKLVLVSKDKIQTIDTFQKSDVYKLYQKFYKSRNAYTHQDKAFDRITDITEDIINKIDQYKQFVEEIDKIIELPNDDIIFKV